MSLKSRYARFGNLVERFDPNKETLVDSLISRVRIDDRLYHNLKTAVAIYISGCLPSGQCITDENKLLEDFMLNRKKVRNCTPNGMLVPKREVLLEFNLVARAFMDVINSFNFGDLLHSWHVPLNVRYKDGHIVNGNLERAYPTEDIHSDSWAGESADSVTTMIPLFGDTERNRVDYYSPPNDFEEKWLGPQSSYKHNAKIAKKYAKIDVPYTKGFLYLADFATLHASARYLGAGSRISIDTTFAFPVQKEKIHPWRIDERAKHKDISNVGKDTLFLFSNSWDEQVYNMGGFKHPSDLKIIKLNKKTE
jgi:hypothetical protein